MIDELAQHVAQHYSDLTASGVDEDAAVRQALAPLGDPARVGAESARAGGAARRRLLRDRSSEVPRPEPIG